MHRTARLTHHQEAGFKEAGTAVRRSAGLAAHAGAGYCRTAMRRMVVSERSEQLTRLGAGAQALPTFQTRTLLSV